MRTSIVVWVIWLLVWHGSGSQAQQQVQVITGPVTIHATAQGAAVSVGSKCQAPDCSVGQGAQGAQITTNIITTGTTIRTVDTQQTTVALHEYVYKNDFAGFRDKMTFLDRKENQASLIGSLQSTDDKGLTIAHLMACVGRPDELSLITQAVQKVMGGLVPLGQKVFKRASLESFSLNASCTSCRADRSQHEVVPHLRLELTNPRQTIFLYGNVTPLECAAAHGHTDAMKLLMQQGVHPGRALFVAQQFGLENNLFEAVRRAKAEGGLGAALHPELPDKLDTPLRKPRQRRTERKAKSKPKSSTGSSAKQATAAAAAPAAAAPACGCNAQPQQQQPSQGSCGVQPVALTMTPQPGVERPGGAPHVIGTVATSLLGVKEKDRDPSKPVSTPNQLSEVMDVTALWLLSIMLLFPAWSTLCLLWRKMLKRRSALHESVTKVRRAVLSVAKPFKPAAEPSAATAAAVAPSAAASGGTGLYRSSTGVPDAEAKGGSKYGGAAARQQRKPGPSIALPASAGSDPAGANKAPSSPTGGLFRAISAPEATFRAHNSSSAHGAKGKDGSQAAAAAGGSSSAGAGVRRQGSSLAATSSVPGGPSAAAGAGAGVAAAATEVPVPALRHSNSTNVAAWQDDKAAAVVAAGAAAAAASSASKGPAGSGAGKQKRGKQAAGATVTFAAAALAPLDAKEKDKESSKGSQHAAAARQTPSSSSSSSSSSGPSKVARTGSGASDSSTGSSPAPAVPTAPKAARGTPQVLFKASKADKHSEATPTDSSTADPALAAKKEGMCKAAASAGVYKTRSEASGLLAAASNRSASRAAVEAAAASVAAASKAAGSSSTSSSIKSPQKPKSALSAALRPGAASPSGTPATAATEGSSSSRAVSHQDATRKDSGKHPALYSPPSRAPSCTAHMTPLSPHAASSSGRFTPSSAAAAMREAAAAASSAAASSSMSLRRTVSGGVMLSPRSPLTDLDDVLNRSRDQDRPHYVAAAAAAAASSRHMGTSAPSGNAWTPAAAAARAARAAGGSAKPHEDDEEDHGEEGAASKEAAGGHSDGDGSEAAVAGSSAQETAAAACDSAAEAAAAPAHEGEGWTGSSSSTGTAGTGTEGHYVDSFTAAAVAAGILPSPTAAAAGPAALPVHGTLHAHDSSLDAADAAAATAYAAAVAALPSDADGEMAAMSATDARAMHSPELDPPVALPRLLSRLDAAPGRPSSSSGGGALLRSVSALEPRGVQDLADLVAAAIAQEVAHGKHLAGPAGSEGAAEEAQGRQSDSGIAGANSSSGRGSTALGSQLTDMPGSQLVQLSLEEVLASALTASQKSADQHSGSVLGTKQGPASAGTADPFSISSADLFADLAEKLKLPARSSPHKAPQAAQQQLDMPVSGPLMQASTEQQQSWFGPAASAGPAGSSSGAMQGGPMGAPVLVDPAGLLCEPPCMAAVNSGSMALPVSTGLHGGPPPGLQMPPVSTVSAMSIPQAPAGTALLTAQHLVALQQQHAAAQPMHQQQQQVMQQQQMVTQPMQQQQLASMQGMQQVQVVPMQQVVGHQQTTVIRLANGQLVQGQVIAMPPMQGAGQMGQVSVVAAAPAGVPQGMMTGGVLNGMQQVQHMVPQQQQNRLFYPQTWAPAAGQGAMCTMVPQAGQQQPQHMYAQQGQHMVQVQMQGGVLQHQMVQVSAQQPMRMQMQGMQGPTMTFHAAGSNNAMLSSSPAQKVTVTPLLGRPVPAAASKQQGQGPGSQQSSSVSGSPKVTVLEAPAGPGASKGVTSPARLQKMLANPQRHNETGVYVAWSPSTAGAVSAQSCSSGAAEPGSPAAQEQQHIDLQPTESAQMAADLDELLQQANQELGFSSLPKGAGKAASVGATTS